MASSPEIVLVDMDGVIVDADRQVLEELEQLVPGSTSGFVRKSFAIADDLELYRNEISRIHGREGFFADLPLVEGALEGWQTLIDLGYAPKICSSPHKTNPWCERDKLIWLQKYLAPVFGATVVSNAVIARDKSAVTGIVLIDDRPTIKGADLAAWKHLVYDRPYNVDSGDFRLKGWGDVSLASLIDQALKERSE